MGKYNKLRQKILGGSSDTDIVFTELCQLLRRFAFEERIKGDHHIFAKNGIDEIINLQPDGNKAKPYQVKQVRSIMLKYRLGGCDVD